MMDYEVQIPLLNNHLPLRNIAHSKVLLKFILRMHKTPETMLRPIQKLLKIPAACHPDQILIGKKNLLISCRTIMTINKEWQDNEALRAAIR